jgi:hypothetical protein
MLSSKTKERSGTDLLHKPPAQIVYFLFDFLLASRISGLVQFSDETGNHVVRIGVFASVFVHRIASMENEYTDYSMRMRANDDMIFPKPNPIWQGSYFISTDQCMHDDEKFEKNLIAGIFVAEDIFL